jgi:hypothetical protein
MKLDSDNLRTISSCANDCLAAGDESLINVLSEGTGCDIQSMSNDIEFVPMCL